ncbi:hypothetical protein R3P38DRAFT_3610418 [Favolaschia claudopus]|uniref:Uncharacterized protein n=1 Tax=Favolaschia claudopus TaxID=2862362 RepID=A0AAW0A611_9AGAR
MYAASNRLYLPFHRHSPSLRLKIPQFSSQLQGACIYDDTDQYSSSMKHDSTLSDAIYNRVSRESNNMLRIDSNAVPEAIQVSFVGSNRTMRSEQLKKCSSSQSLQECTTRHAAYKQVSQGLKLEAYAQHHASTDGADQYVSLLDERCNALHPQRHLQPSQQAFKQLALSNASTSVLSLGYVASAHLRRLRHPRSIIRRAGFSAPSTTELEGIQEHVSRCEWSWDCSGDGGVAEGGWEGEGEGALTSTPRLRRGRQTFDDTASTRCKNKSASTLGGEESRQRTRWEERAPLQPSAALEWADSARLDSLVVSFVLYYQYIKETIYLHNGFVDFGIKSHLSIVWHRPPKSAQSGTGKIATFSISILQSIDVTQAVEDKSMYLELMSMAIEASVKVSLDLDVHAFK